MKPRFLLDEQVNRAIQRQLRRLNPNVDVLAIGDPGAPSTGMSDPDILTWLEKSGYIFVTENRSTIPRHLSDHFAAGRHVPGGILDPSGDWHRTHRRGTILDLGYV